MRQKRKGQDILLQEKKNSEISKYWILPYIQNRKLGNLRKCSFTSNFDSCCNLRFRNDINELRQKLKGNARYAFRRKKMSEVSEFSILLYTQNRKLGNLGKRCFTSNFISSCNLRCKNDKKITEAKIYIVLDGQMELILKHKSTFIWCSHHFSTPFCVTLKYP